jgi:DNA-directed RNA polymerase specialized sigma24 family protein
MALQPYEIATKEDVAAALLAISGPDALRLKRVAKARSKGLSSMDWEDLLQESGKRALSLSRQWPRDVPFIAFMIKTIRGIANDERNKLYQQNERSESTLSHSGSEKALPTLDDFGANIISAEREMMAERTLEEITALFEDDSEVLAILAGIAEGRTPTEIQLSSHMNPTQYASAQRRIRRGIDRAYPSAEET